MKLAIAHPRFAVSNGKYTNCLYFEVERITDETCVFERYEIVSDSQSRTSGPPLVYVGEGSWESIREDLRGFIRAIFDIEAVGAVLVHDNHVVVNPYVELSCELLQDLEKLIEKTWNLPTIDSQPYALEPEALRAGDDDWPELIE